jgi:autotransporter family porin
VLTSVPRTVLTSVPPTPVTSGQVSVLAPGTALPSDATCAAKVQPVAEVRPDNAQYNATRGSQKNLTGPYPMFRRVDGNFTGTTDEIIQWTACKWGIAPDIVRAQAVVESNWHQKTLGDTTSNPTVCAPHHPIGSDSTQPGVCPESVGLLQVRYQYWKNGFDDVETSTAYNSDYVYAAWRSCYEGQETWLGGTYGPGDVWGCLGVWFSGQWHTSPADQYISKVKSAFQNRTWTESSFAQG